MKSCRLGSLLIICGIIFTIPLRAAGSKSSGNTNIVDDLTTGSAGSVGLNNGILSLSGSIGQVGTSAMLASNITLEGGYFSKMVSSESLSFVNVYVSTIVYLVTDPGNSSGTIHNIRVSTESAFAVYTVLVSSQSQVVSAPGLTPNTTYYAREQANYMEGDGSDLSNTVGTVTLAMSPQSPSFVATTTTTATILWGAGSNPSYTQYKAEISTSSGFFSSGDISTSWISTTVATFSSLSAGTTYFARVKAKNGSVQPVETAYVSAGSTVTVAAQSSGASSSAASIPAAVSNTYPLVTTYTVVAQWSANGNSADTIYETHISSFSNFSTLVTSSSTLLTSATFSALTPNTTYYLRVKASTSASATFSDYLSLASTVTLAAQPVASAFSQISTTTLQANWLANDNPSGTRYNLIFSSGALPSTNGFSGNLSSTTLNTYVLFNALTSNTTYYAIVRAINTNGITTSYTDISSARTLSSNELTFISGRVTQSNGQGLSGIVVEAADQDSKATVKTTLTEASGTGAFQITGLTALKKYIIKVIWTANNVTSYVLKDNVPTGTADLSFNLAVTYNLATLSGTLALSNSVIETIKTVRLQNLEAGPRRYSALAQGNMFTGEPFIEIFSGSQLIARTPVDDAMNYEVKNIMPGSYRVVGFNGRSYSQPEYISLAEGQSAHIALEFPLLEPESVFAFPNPAQSEVTIRFVSYARSIEAKISIYDIAGNLVKEFSNNDIADAGSGIYRARWNTANNNGERVASGVYLFVVNARNKDNNQTKKVVKKLAIIR